MTPSGAPRWRICGAALAETVRIVPAGLHWIGPEPERDLCAHGGIEVLVDGEPFITGEGGDLALSTGALHLLRTLRADHTPEAPLAEHLVPHCGHFMHMDESTGEVINLGCPLGANWWVRHDGDAVLLTREDGAGHRTRRHAWTLAVAEFADAVDAFYASSPARQMDDDYDAEWFAAFRAEWARRRTAARDP